MQEVIKKLTVVSVLLLFLASGLAGASSVLNSGNSNNDSANTQTITLYQYGPDGSIASANIAYSKGQNLEEVIAEKCSEMIDSEIGERAQL